MSLWHYIGEFFLLRWLFGTHGCGKDRHYGQERHDTLPGRDALEDTRGHAGRGPRHDHDGEYGHSPYDGDWQSDEDFLEEQEDYDMLDDL